jgi:hypothetical protein
LTCEERSVQLKERNKVGRRRGRPGWLPPVLVGGALVILTVLMVTFTGGNSSPDQLAGAPPDEHGADDIPYPAVERIDVDEAYAMVQSDSALLVDVRERSAYEEAHVAGALALPEAELATRIGELPREQLIITYCT